MTRKLTDDQIARLGKALGYAVAVTESERDDKPAASRPQRCSICGRPFTGYGHNAWPVNAGRCCEECNVTVVIPARIDQLGSL
jgi:hypothetical protein